ncbi:MAG: 5-oxoprolinase subunit PxpB [Planctomycetota bacterium]
MSRPLLRVLRAGLMTTVQDLGRAGYGYWGVPLGGALDRLSHRLANRLVGNPDSAAALEMTVRGDDFECVADCVIAVCGADMQPQLETPKGRCLPFPCQRPVQIRRGSLLRFGAVLRGCRAILAVAGGIDVPQVLGSRSTLMRGGWGGFQGRRLEAGDVVWAGDSQSERFGSVRAIEAGMFSGWEVRLQWLPGRKDTVLRFLPGTHFQSLSMAARDLLLGQGFEVRSESDRMGYRLRGPGLALVSGGDGQLKSAAVVPGTLQLPHDGQLVLLMADCAPTGGYPRIGHLISADLPLAAQLRPGSILRLELTSAEVAWAALREQERSLRMAIAGVG